jgi:hypothetical protein
MKRPLYRVTIDRLALTGLGLTPLQAEQLVRQVTEALQQRLAAGGAPAEGREIDRLALPPTQWDGRSQPLAECLASSLADAISGAEQQGEQQRVASNPGAGDEHG